MEHNQDVRGIVDWLIRDAAKLDATAVVSGLALRLISLGIPLDRFSISFAVLNPSVMAAALLWRPDRPIDVIRYAYARRNDGQYEHSPFKDAQDTGRWVIVDLATTPDERYGIIPELRAEGIRHYVVVPLRDSAGRMINLTLATKGDAPFSDDHKAMLEAIIPALSLIVEIKTLRSTFRNILAAYVGSEPAVQIMDGTVHLGQVTEMRAAMLLADLRGFTHLSTQMPPEATADVINRYYDILVPPVMANGGEVLKFIGDAVLAVFPAEAMGDDQAALQAMKAARTALDTPIEPFMVGDHPVRIRFGIGLHLGDAVYGNVGSGDRLDFTVIGRDVNIAARIAALCSRLGRDYLVSDTVAAIGRRHGHMMADAGAHPVRGLNAPLHVHVPDVADLDPAHDDGVSQGLALAPD